MRIFWETVSDELKHTAQIIFEDSFFSDFALGGGTALALQLGHRFSIDIDLFCNKDFDKPELMQYVQTNLKPNLNFVTGKFGVFGKINNIKTDFLYFNLPLN
jgi:hypothetical protein